MDNLQQIFNGLVSKYTDNTNVADRLWRELDLAYSQSTRLYHTLDHLGWMLDQLVATKVLIKAWEPIMFALFYHDVVYSPLSKENEENSAGLARKRLREIGVMPYTIENCGRIILATKDHQKQENTDANYFLDADLSILGADWDTYHCYLLNIRTEYAVYPDEVYIPGRERVLESFLTMPSIFKTQYFYHRFEQQAKNNIKKEIELLRT